MRHGVLIGALAVAIVGAVGLLLGFLFEPGRTVVSSLVGLTFGMTTAVGALWLLMVGYVVRSHWLQRLRPLNEGLALLIPIFGLFLIPLLIGLEEVYVWAAPERAELSHHEQELLAHKSAWLNEGGFIVRSIAYVVLWTALAAVLFIFRRRPATRATQWTSGLGLPILGLTFSLAAFDWQMSLNPFWFSTMYGVYILAGGFLASLAWLCVLSPLTVRMGRMPLSLRESTHPLGILTHAFVIFWSYISFMQLLIIWSANLPEEVVYYERRIVGDWRLVAGALIVAHFFIPFFALLFRYIKRNPVWLAGVGVWLIVMHAVDVIWMTLPTLDGPASVFQLQDVAAFLLVIGVLVAFVIFYAARERGRVGTDDLIEEGGHVRR